MDSAYSSATNDPRNTAGSEIPHGAGARVAGDQALVAEVIEGSEPAFAKLYDRYAADAYGLALAIVRDTADAEDVVAAAFDKVWQDCTEYDPARGGVRGWIMTVVRSRALDSLRTRARRQRYESAAGSVADPVFQVEPSPLAVVEQQEASRLVRDALRGLTDAQRRVLELAYFRGLSHTEIAEFLNEPLGTVKTRIRSAMAKLREQLRGPLGGGDA